MFVFTACAGGNSSDYKSPRPENFSLEYVDANNSLNVLEKVGKNYYFREGDLNREWFYKYNEEKGCYDVSKRACDEGAAWESYEPADKIVTDDAVLGATYSASFFDTSFTRDYGRKPKQTGVSMLGYTNVEVYDFSDNEYYYAPDYDIFFKMVIGADKNTWQVNKFTPNITAFKYGIPA